MCISVAKCPQSIQAEEQEKFIRLWKHILPSFEDHLMTPFCPRNILLFSKSTSETWNRLEHLVIRLMDNEILTPLVLESQCVALNKAEWPEDTLKKLGGCLRGIIDSWKRRKGVKSDDDFGTEFEVCVNSFATKNKS